MLQKALDDYKDARPAGLRRKSTGKGDKKKETQ